MVATQKVSHTLSQFEEPQTATRSMKTVRSFLILIFNQYPAPIFLLVFATILTHRNL